MIWKVWFKITSVLFLSIIPLMVAQYFLQKESIELTFDVSKKSSPIQIFDQHLDLLKKISKLDPHHEEDYRIEFEKVSDAKIASLDIQDIQSSLVRDLLRQTLRNTLLVLLVSLALAFIVARTIVILIQRLNRENQAHLSRLEKLSSLESWQRVARMMVHELRGPITPMKLISTDIENKYALLEPEAFRKYLFHGSKLIRDQISALERLIESLTRFAKLPEVKKVPYSVSDLLFQFIGTYKGYQPNLQIFQRTYLIQNDLIPLDKALLNQILFNLLKNACEANLGKNLVIDLNVRQNETRTWISISNNGDPIPDSIASKIFDLYVSTKTETSNLGMGLTISRKIALDHGGDLYLKNNGPDHVEFELELPNL